MEYNPSGKIQRVARGNLMSPGSCFSCGGASNSIYALVGWTEYDGAFYICESCAMSIMTIFPNLMLPSNELTLRDEITRLEKVIKNLETHLTKEQKINESFRTVFTHTGIDDPSKPRNSSVASSAGNGNGRTEHVLDGSYTIDDEPRSKGPVAANEPAIIESDDGSEADIARILEDSAVSNDRPVPGNDEAQRDSSKPHAGKRRSRSASPGLDPEHRTLADYGI